MIVSVFVFYICISMLYVFVFMLHLIDHVIKVCLHDFSVGAKTSRNRHFADAKTPEIIGEVSRLCSQKWCYFTGVETRVSFTLSCPYDVSVDMFFFMNETG